MSRLTILVSIFSLVSISLTQAEETGFTVELIHRDSPKSPFYNPLETPYQRLTKTLRRSNRNLNLPSPDIDSNQGSYLLKLSIGTPPQNIIGIADTGSDLIWTQCIPCKTCFHQNFLLFRPGSSTTYHNLPCTTNGVCANTLPGTTCTSNKTCSYSIKYADGSFSSGNLATETLTLGSTSVAVPSLVFGCGNNNGGNFDGDMSGIVGLGGGKTSLVSQLGALSDGKFSYCLIPFTSQTVHTSKLNFGTNAIVSGNGVVSTPLVSKQPNTFYFLSLQSIVVGNKTIPYEGGSTEGNVIIDSGTTLTNLPRAVNAKVLAAIASTIDQKPVKDPEGLLDLCYSNNRFKVPDVTVIFKGAAVKLEALNVFVQVQENLVCCTFRGAETEPAIYGSLHQMNFLIGYDTKSRTVSFQSTDCTKH